MNTPFIPFNDLPPSGKIVALTGWVRLTWKGESPRMPTQVSDPDGTLWTCNVDWKDRVIRVEKRTGAFGPLENRRITEYRYTPEQIEPTKKDKKAA